MAPDPLKRLAFTRNSFCCFCNCTRGPFTILNRGSSVVELHHWLVILRSVENIITLGDKFEPVRPVEFKARWTYLDNTHY